MAFTTNFGPTNPSGLGGLPQGGAITLNGAWPGQPGGIAAKGQPPQMGRRPMQQGQMQQGQTQQGQTQQGQTTVVGPTRPGIRNSPFGAFGAFNPQAHQFTKQLFGL